MTKSVFVCIIISIFFVINSAFAEITPFRTVTGTIDQFETDSRPIDLVFLNGIDNSEPQALASLQKLRERYIANGKYSSEVEFSYIYNPTGGEIDDNTELEAMGDITTAARSYADAATQRHFADSDPSTKSRFWNAFYKAKVRKLYTNWMLNAHKENPDSKPAIGSVIQKIQTSLAEKILAGHKVVVVSHSQGNLFAEATYSYMVKNMTTEQLKAIKFVGVASVASTIPNDGFYTSFNQDEAITLYEKLYGLARERNFDAVRMVNNEPQEMDNTWAGYDEICHSFLDYYMNTSIVRRGDSDRLPPYNNNVAKKIITDVDNSIDQCVATNSEITLSFLTATLTWINNSTDIDLWMYEPNSTELTKIYFNNKVGTAGYLDIDDVDGYGPEHIYLSNDTTADMSGTYNIWAHAYAAPSGDIATIGINLENNTVYSRTFDVLNYDKQCVFKLILAKRDFVYDFTLSVCD